MPRHLFLSFLGTGNYSETRYFLPHAEQPEPPSKFTQVAILNHILQGGLSPSDFAARILTTPQAYESNWLDGPDEKAGLGRILKALGVEAEPVQIPDGGNEEELWAIFLKLLEQVDEGDILYVDVTHGFRSLPVLMVKALDYVVQVKGARIERLDYGAFEKDREKSPIFDLTPYLILEEWARALTTFQNSGDLLYLARVLKQRIDELQGLLRQETPAALRSLPSRFYALGEALELCNLREIHPRAAALVQTLDEASAVAREHSQTLPLEPILATLQERIKPMTRPEEERLAAQIAAVAYCFEFGRYIQGYTLLRETLVDFLEAYAREMGIDGSRANKVDGLFGWAASRGQKNEAPRIPEGMEAVCASLEQESFFPDLAKLCNQIGQERNKLDHAGTGQKLSSMQKLRSKAGEHLARAQELLAEEAR